MDDDTTDYTSLLGTAPKTLKPHSPLKSRQYKKTILSPAKKQFAKAYALTENGVKSIDAAYPNNTLTYGSKAEKAHRLLRNEEIVNHIEYQRNKLEEIATKAVTRVSELVDSDNEAIATTNSWKVIEQVQGKAMQKSTNVNYNFTKQVEDKKKQYDL